MNVRIYLRVSRETEAEIFENQRAIAIAYVRDKLGLENALVYSEIVSAKTILGRRGLRTLLRDVAPQDLVVFTAPSRMTRGGAGAALGILEYLQAHNVYWHFIEYPILNYDSSIPTWMRDMILAVFAALDQAYSDRIKEATRRGLAKARAAGKKLGGARRGAGRPSKLRSLADVPLEPEAVEIQRHDETHGETQQS